MKFKFLLLLMLIALTALPAAAQERASLKTLPAGEIYEPADKAFSVALPRAGVKTEAEMKGDGDEREQTLRYKWKLAEGSVSLAVITYATPNADSPALIDALLAVTARRHREEGAEIISQRTLDIGKTHGGEFVRKQKGRTIIFRMFVKGMAMYTLYGEVDKKAADAEKLIARAFDSFRLKEDATETAEKAETGGLFGDPEKRFTIALPLKADEIKTNSEPGKDGSATQYKWLLREGTMYVSVTTFTQTSFDRKIDVDAYLDDLAAALAKLTEYGLVSRTAISQGDFTGGEIVRGNKDGKLIVTRVLARGQVMYTLNALTDPKADDAEKLMRAALESFKIVTDKKP